MSSSRLLPIAILLLATACSARGPGTAGRADRNVISTEEMLEAGYNDAFTTVQTLRPQWLSRRGVSTINMRESVKVYLDGSLMGGPDQLQQIRTRSISSIRYMDGIEASQRWGLDHGLGAIVVSTRKDAKSPL
jgi:hypothetical protein